MSRRRIGVIVSVAMLAVLGLGVGIGLAVAGPDGRSATAGTPGLSWYRSMMGRYYGGSMMGGSSGGWMMGREGYRSMMGGASAPGWMRGGQLPATMMGTSTDPGKIMGGLWATAPAPRVSPQQAARLGSQVPAGASVNRARNAILFTGTSVHLVAVASPAGGPDETFRIAGLVNPAITVPAGSRVSIQVVNADPHTAHGLVITAASPRSSWMPMMTAAPAFSDSALWFLGNPTAAGMHTGTLTFTASYPGSYHYLCPVPGHAQKGMAGAFTIANAP